MPARILFVCTANICRSPAAESLARSGFGEDGAIFRSAGFLKSGESCPEFLLQALDEIGVDAAGHRSYQLDPASVNAADLILTMEGQHVQKATVLVPEAFPRIMPLKEAARAIASLGPGASGLDALLERVNRRRDPSVYLTSQWDVEDPYGRKLKDYRRAVTEIAGLVEGVIGRLL